MLIHRKCCWWVKAYHVVLWPGHRVVSFDEKLCFFLSLFTQVYKWVLPTYCRGVTSCLTSIPSPHIPSCFVLLRLGMFLLCGLHWLVSACYLIFCVVNDLSFGKTGNSNVQLVLQNCCWTSWKAMLRVLPPTSVKPVNNLICCKTGLV